MPICVTILLPAYDLEAVLPSIEKMVTDGIVVVRELNVVSHKTRNRLFPRQLKVKEVMTAHPATVKPSTPVSDVIRLLLPSIFTGVPVVDDLERPVGVISQGNLIYRAGMPLRLCLLGESDPAVLESFFNSVSYKTAAEIMTSPAVCIMEDKPLTEAVDLMLQKELKRLPVIDARGKIIGIISRMDVFRAIMKEAPDWQAFRQRSIQVEDLHFVSDIMRRDTHAVLQDTPVDEILQIIDSNDIQRVAVVDAEGRYLGLISDEDLLMAFSDHRAGLWDYIVNKMSFSETERKHKEFMERWKGGRASDVMNTKHATIQENAPIEEAIRIMTENNLKRLPVVEAQGKYRGMVSRESLLRIGYGWCNG